MNRQPSSILEIHSDLRNAVYTAKRYRVFRGKKLALIKNHDQTLIVVHGVRNFVEQCMKDELAREP